MIETTDWLGRPVRLAESSGGVLAFAEPLAGLVRGVCDPWPTAAIVQKLYRSRQQRAFSGQDLEAVTSALGYYTDLQSVHSEDAITWNVFGPVAHGPPEVREAFATELLSLADFVDSEGPAALSLWRRIPHPETLVPGGPELDAIVQTATTVVLVEAKWRSSVGSRQGKNRDRDQIGLRVEFLERFGSSFFPGVDQFVVLGASWRDPVISEEHRQVHKGKVHLRNLTWEILCSMESHPDRDELERYYDWKVEHTSGP